MISKKYVFLSNEGKKESEEVTEYLFNGKWLVCKNCSQRCQIHYPMPKMHGSEEAESKMYDTYNSKRESLRVCLDEAI